MPRSDIHSQAAAAMVTLPSHNSGARLFRMFSLALVPIELLLKVCLGILRSADRSHGNVECFGAKCTGARNGSTSQPFSDIKASHEHES